MSVYLSRFYVKWCPTKQPLLLASNKFLSSLLYNLTKVAFFFLMKLANSFGCVKSFAADVRYHLTAPDAFCWGHEGDECPSTLRCQFVLMVWSSVLESMVLSLPDVACSYRFLQPSSAFSSTIWLLYCHQLLLHLTHNEPFWLLSQCYSPVQIHKSSN